MAIAISLAFLMTLITASSNIVLKKGFHKIHPFVAVYLSVVLSTVLLWIATFVFSSRTSFYNYKAILVFVLIGSFAPTIVRTLTYYGIHTLGAGRSAPLRAMTPFFATIFAIIFLKESPHNEIFVGILFLVIGITLLSQREEKDMSQWKPVHVFYPLGAALLAGIAANLRKYGLGLMPDPVFASAIAATSSLVILTFYTYIRFKKELTQSFGYLNELRLIGLAALLTSIGEVVDLSALLFGKVSLVVPIFAVTPLSIVFLSHIFLKKHEKITKKIVIATFIIILGVYFIILSA